MYKQLGNIVTVLYVYEGKYIYVYIQVYVLDAVYFRKSTQVCQPSEHLVDSVKPEKLPNLGILCNRSTFC